MSSDRQKREQPEDVLVLQFQGMIAEYRKAQISERAGANGVVKITHYGGAGVAFAVCPLSR